MRKATLTGDCSVCDRKEVKVRHFEVCAATGEAIPICLKCQPPNKGGDGPKYPHVNPAAVSVALADAGFRGPIKDTCLSMLTRWACCLRCGSGSDDLIFLPIDGSEYGIYLCPTCQNVRREVLH